MSIIATDLKTRFSTKLGTAGNQLSGTAAGSLGKFISTTDWPGGTLNDLFPDNTGTENAAGISQYRCLFVCNLHSTLTWTLPVIWISSEVSGGADISIGIDPTAASILASIADQAVTITDDLTAPIGVTFTSPITKGTGLAIGDLLPGQCRAFWVKRTTSNSPALSADGFDITIEGDTL